VFYGGSADLLLTQAIGVVSIAAFVAVSSAILFSVLKATVGLRVSYEEELAGLDVFEHGTPGYGPDVAPPMAPTPVSDGSVRPAMA